jgi:hypothetical protein
MRDEFLAAAAREVTGTLQAMLDQMRREQAGRRP